MPSGTNKGYIRLHRQVQDCWVWFADKKFSKGQAWVDLLMLANHQEKKIIFNGEPMVISRGQYLTSIRSLAERWGWSKDSVARFLTATANDKMIKKESDSHRTLITIVNYGVYQYSENENETQIGQKQGHAQGHKSEKTINEINVNKCNIYNAHFEDVWKIYPRRKDKSRAYQCYMARINSGFSEEELYEATKNYAEECKKEDRPEKYIKIASTFFGVNTPFVDYIPAKESRDIKVINLEGQTEEEKTAYPRYGFPEEWFKGDTLYSPNIYPVKDSVTGQEYTVNDLVDLYYLRRGRAYGDEGDLEFRRST